MEHSEYLSTVLHQIFQNKGTLAVALAFHLSVKLIFRKFAK